jgi:hypothetical protein
MVMMISMYPEWVDANQVDSVRKEQKELAEYYLKLAK